MPATYKYGFLPKNRERAMRAAGLGMIEARKTAAKLQKEMEALHEKLRAMEALLVYGNTGVFPDGPMRKKVEDAIAGDND